MSLDRRIGIGVLWNLVSILMSRGSSLFFTLFLARLLAPEAFGLIAMISVAFELANVLALSGLGQALIRSKTASQVELSTAFIANLGLSAVSYALLYFSAHWVAGFYGRVELTLLVRVSGVVVFFQALKLVQTAVLHRALNFRAETIANTVGAVVSGVVAVVLAYLGAGVWSLVAQMLVATGVSAGLLWLQADWRPSLKFSVPVFLVLFSFGSRLAVEGVLDALFRNSYVLVIGRLFSAELTGVYFFAKRLTDLVSNQLSGAVQQATYPALASLQEDNTILRAKYRQVLQLTVFIIAPSLLLMAALADSLFALVFDPVWSEAVPYLRWLSLAGVMYPIHALNVNILKVKGRSDLILGIGLVKKTVSLGLLAAAIPFGVEGVVVSQVIGSALALVPNTYYVNKLIEYGIGAQLMDALKPIASAVVAALFTWLVVPFLWTGVFGLVSGAVIGVLVYLVSAALIGAEGWDITVRFAQERNREAS